MFVIELKDKVLIVRVRDIVFTVGCILFSMVSLLANVCYAGIPVQYRQVAFLIQSDLVWFMAMMLIVCLKEPIRNRAQYLVIKDGPDDKGKHR